MARSNKITLTCTRTGVSHTGTPDELAEFFYRDKSTKTGFSPWCKDAERAYNKAYRAGLEKAGTSRKADADEKGKQAFDSVMQSQGQRTARKSAKSESKSTKAPSSRKVDGTRTRAAKARTNARRVARTRKVAVKA